MQTTHEIISKHGITLRRHSGTERTTCPECSPHRKNKSDRCLSVTVKADGVQWFCHHCSWSGGAFFDEPEQHQQDRQPRQRR